MSIGSSPWLDGWDPEPERERILQILDVARRYYEDGLSQAEIAQAIGYSRPTVGRMLEEARRSGVVRIQITHPLERSLELERVIATRFGLANVRIVDAPSPHDAYSEIGAVCAQLLARVLRPGMRVGLTTGRVHQAVATHLKPSNPALDITFVQLAGGLSGDNPLMNGPEVCRRFAQAFGGVAVTMEAPLLVRNAREARDVRALPDVSRALADATKIDMAIVGIGAGFRHSTGVFDHLISTPHLRALRKEGAVGHVLAQFVDKDGAVIRSPVQDLVIALPLEKLREIPHVIGIASGSHKAEAIMAALNGRLLNGLIVDRPAAQSLAYHHPRKS